MWAREAHDAEQREKWYKSGLDYWQNVDASVDGVLGGYGAVSDSDIDESEAFLRDVTAVLVLRGSRKTCFFTTFMSVFQVDVLEPAAHFLQTARTNLASGGGKRGPWPGGHAPGRFFEQGLQEFKPEAGRYDVIWVQWVTGHLTDEDFITFFQQCADAVQPDGLIILKENNAKKGFVLDKDDCSITRSDAYITQLFKKAGLTVIRHRLQRSFPKELFAVRMYAIKAKSTPESPS
eukprot:jgi/Chlat1/983/Chrsp108S01412